ncbi:MAG: WecB/TagA/CpsF family glycosyltransferase [Rhizobiales bacterium]|uniref:WecB/TagA/CpsF family glycosyltransferase n=1 Tax=Microbacterium sp. TaxID=51671 RepID=UPI001ACC6453|nr:WecB/TagA/CpsF family glycosyltransferase [Microbacterium sp.]MBN9015230.1 WecB/TagA/CpsF family glycosyltransferase [Hyphomicrobiales bacterium]
MDGMAPRIELGLLSASPLSFSEIIAGIDAIVERGQGAELITPVNATMLHVAHDQPVLVEAVRRASLAPCDGWPIVAIARRVARDRGIERVTGADLLPKIVMERDYRVLLVGGARDAALLAAAELKKRGARAELLPSETVPPEEYSDPERRKQLVARITQSGADIIFLGLGIPKQEVLALQCLEVAQKGVYVCCGAAIDFVAGFQSRAPGWVRGLKLEWLWRIASNPRRLAGRYISAVPELVRVSRRARVLDGGA